MSEWLTSLRLRLRSLLRRRQLERDLQDELAFHLAMREEQLRASGASDARQRARRRFGNVTIIREELRERWAFAPRASSVIQDLSYAARTFRHSPGFAVVVVLTLGLGLGANTAFFSVVNAALLRPLGYADEHRLVAVHEAFPDSHIERWPFSALDFEDLQRHQDAFEGVAAYRATSFELSGEAPDRVQGAKVSASLFRTLGVNSVIGRTFDPAEDRPGVHVAILSWGLWQRRYGADPAIVGRSIRLDREPYTIIGVMPKTFGFPFRGPQANNEPADVWVPIAFTDRERVERGSNFTNSVVARLKRGVSLDMARAQLDVLAVRIAGNYPAAVRNAGFTPHLSALPLREEISGRSRFPLLMLLAAGGVVVLVACASVANLMLSRAAGRRREFAVRTALGARRGRLTQLLLCEALLLSAAGGALGVALAYWSVTAVPAVLTRSIPGSGDVPLDVRVLAFAAMTCLATSFIFAVLPAGTIDRRSPGDALREDTSRTTVGRRGLRMRQGSVISAVALAFVLLVGASLLVRSLSALLATDLGFREAQVVTASMTLPQTAYATPARVRGFHEALLSALSTAPEVRSASLSSDFPLTSSDVRRFEPEGSAAAGRMTPMTKRTWVRGPYFETFGMTVRQGRFFSGEEHVEDRRVVIVNETLARRFWPGQDAVGKRLKWGTAQSQYPWLTVVGVVSDVADGPIGEEPDVHAYEPARQVPDFFLGRTVNVAVSAGGNTRALPMRIREEIRRLDPQLPIESLELMKQRVNDAFAPQRFSTRLIGAFAAIALLLASVGLYGLLAFWVAQQRQEIAVRIALGAEPRAVVRMVVGHGARPAIIGAAIGLVGSLLLTRFLTSFLYQTEPYDRLTFAAVPAVLMMVVLIACALPAWRATRFDPMTALRAE